MANTACSVKIPSITSAFISKEGNEILSAMRAPRYIDYINYLFGNVFKREYLDNNSFVTLSDFTDDNNKLTVSGNLNNLYTKVKEELVNQINDPLFLSSSEISEEVKNKTYEELAKILENWKLFVDFHSKYNAYVIIEPENLEENKEINVFDKKGNEHTEFQLITNEVRTLFKFLPQTIITKDSLGNLVGTPVINPTDGLPIRADFENIFKLTLDVLKGIKDEDKFIEKLTSDEVLYRIPELFHLFEILPVNNNNGVLNLTNKQRLLFHKFYLIMSRDYIPVHASTLTLEQDKLPSHIRYASAKSNIDKIEKQFISNFISNQEENEYVKIDNTIDEQKAENSIYGRRRLYSLPKKLPLIDLSDSEILTLTPFKIKSQYKEYFDFFKLLGIEFSDFSLLSNKKQLINVLNSALTIHDNLSQRLDRNIKIYNPIEDLRQQIKYPGQDGKPKTIISLRNTLKNIFKFEGTISKISPTSVTKAANGENQSDITYANAISIAVQQLNDSKSLEDLYTKPYFKKLKYNPLHKNSYTANKIIGNENIDYSLENYSGYTIITEDESASSDTKSLSDRDKFISDFNNLLGWGTINTPQLESKSGYFAIKFIDKTSNKPLLPFSESLFTNDFITNSDFTAQILHYLNGEIERVKTYNRIKEYTPKAYSEFYIFKNFISEELKKDLLKEKNTTEYKKAEEKVLSNINNYFNIELDNLQNFIKKNNINNFISSKVLAEAKINEELFNKNKETYTNSLLRTFIANDFIHNVEFGIFISGDPLFYKDYHKRLGGLSSTGTQPFPTNNIRLFFNSDSEKLFWNNFSLRGILNEVFPNQAKERRDNFNTFLSAVLQENNIKEGTEYQNPKTIDDYIYSVKLNSGIDITREKAISDLKLDEISKKGINVADGQGYLNLDAARELSIKQGTYRPQQDVSYRFEALLFKQMLLEEKGETLNLDEFKLLKKEERRILQDPDKYALPTLKQTYYGTISNENIEIDAKVFDKFSLAILLPSTAKNHPELKKLLLAMAKRQIHYVKYESGTKGFIRDVFRNAEEIDNEKNELDELETSLLKLQITPSETEKIFTKIPTQQIKLLFANLFDGNVANESIKKLRDKFLSDLNNIKDYNRKNILKKLGFELNENGKISFWNKEKIIDALVSQVNLQKLPTPLLEALETNENGNFVNTLESSNIYQQLLNYITGKLDSTLREFKVNGGDFVLISESMFETPLKYVRLNKNKSMIENMDCRITLTKEYSKLLNLPDLQNKNKVIGTINRLNELLKLPKFVEKYKKELTIAFSRPPVQGQNSMGVATIVEFFYPTAGNILQLPKEFMHQAGIDFDYDKEKVFIPSLSNEGLFISDEKILDRIKELDKEYSELRDIYNYYEDNVNPEEVESYEEYVDLKNQLLSNDEYTRFLSKIFNISIDDIPTKLNQLGSKIDEYFILRHKEKNILSNNLFQTIQEILQQPETYSELILPNTNETVRPLAIENGKEINNLNELPIGIDVYSYQQNLKVFKLFNDAKALLGPFALQNVFMELIAPLDIKVNLDYSPDKDGIPQKKVNLLLSNSLNRVVNISSKYDNSGNVKQHITSEFINATVDSAKDPYFANFMLSFENINTFTFLMTLGYPVDLIIDFTSSAAIRRYLDLKKRGLRVDEAFSKVRDEIRPIPSKKKVTISDIFKEDVSNIGMDNSELLLNLKKLKLDESLDKNSGNYSHHIALLVNFIAIEEHSKQFSNFKNLFKNDTNKTSSLYEISSKKSLRNIIIANNMFSEESILKVENNSTMTAFRNDDLIEEILKVVFPIMSNPIVYKGLGDLFNSSKPNLKEVDKRILSQVITNDYITSILFSFGTYKNQNFFLYGRDLITKNKKEDGSLNVTLLERIYKFRQNKAYSELIKQFPVLTKILGEVSSKPLKRNQVYQGKHAFNVLLNIDPNIPIFEKESFMYQFKQIIEGNFTTENSMVKNALINLIQDFFIAGLIQSGFNKTNIGFLEYAPVKFIQSLLNPALKQYNYTEKNDTVFLEKYVEYFSKNLFRNNNSKYFFFKKEEKGFIVKNSHLGKYLYVPNVIRPVKQVSTQIETNIYSQFGNKTQSENVVIKPWGELKNATQAITNEGVISTRIPNTNEHFGNPFSHDPTGKTQGLIKTETIKKAVEKYIDWVINSNDERAQWIRKELKSGNLKNQPIFYYKELGEPSHATALDYLINKYDWNTKIIESKIPNTINIYSTDKNGFERLSNLLNGPITIDGFVYKTVEHLYQWKKAEFAENNESANKIFLAKTGFDAQKLGKSIKGLNKEEWDKVSSEILESAMRLAFEQNQDARTLLLSTGNSLLTHKSEANLGKWETEFPRILMKIRAELKTIGISKGLSSFVNHSGGAIGSDSKWDEIGAKFGMINNRHYWMSEKTPKGNTEISTEDSIEGQQKATIAARQMGRINPTHQVRDVRIIRNWSQVKYSEAVFAIGSFHEAREEMKYGKKALIKHVKGGTGYAVQMAINEGKTVYVFDQVNKQWFKNVNGKWLASETPILTQNFAGIGTREINEFGEQAIEDIYKNTINNLSKISSQSEVTTEESKTEEEIKDISVNSDNIATEVGDNLENQEEIQLEPTSSFLPNKNVFEYNGVSIDTEFQLGEQQQEALENLINFVNSNQVFVTLQGAAGTGKTTIIGYLQKYLGRRASFAYIAPTHAATAELAFATVKTGNETLPSTLQSSLAINPKTKKSIFSQKLKKRLGYSNPIIILDEASMIDASDINKLTEAIEDIGGKIIFLGDEKQISKVTTDNADSKKVSPAFTQFNQVRLTKIYRQSDNSLLNLLSKMREQNDFKLFRIENSDTVKFLNRRDFNSELIADLLKDAENTVVVTYTNNSVKGTNTGIRSILGRTGQTIIDDIIVGYLGYASKQIEKKDIANSISYKITNIQERGSIRYITAKSSKLAKLISLGISGIEEYANTSYYQLSKDDSLTFDNLTQLDFDKNNRELADMFKRIHKANVSYANKEITYHDYLSKIADFSEKIREYSVGNDYIYNPLSDMMERFDPIKHKNIKHNGQGSLLFNKDIDYGHAITIHKSQGSTINNVYFDSSSLKSAKNTKIIDEQGNQITTEKMSLAYVAMSRSKNKLVVYEGENDFEFLKNQIPQQDNPDLDEIGFKKTCE